uniref:DUF58 domain-containing protein n=1 Tax=mine drainage metagenome TaxID=410659 RepID=E6PM64_9ZZZZ
MPGQVPSTIGAVVRALRRHFGQRLGQRLRPGLGAFFATPDAAAARLLRAADWAEIAALLRQSTGAVPSARSARRRNPGEGRSVFTGRGMDYAESRIYQAGDDLRTMHWQLLARTGKPHVKLHHEEHAGHWHGLVDARGTMLFGTRVRTKAQQAARAVLLAAGLQARVSPQTSIACTLWRADGLHSRHFGRGLVAVRRLAAWLLAEPLPRPAISAAAPRADAAAHERADFLAWTQRLRAHQPGPSLLVLGSDWGFADAATDAALWRLATNADLLALQLRDPAELELPALPQSWFVDLQTGAAGWVESGPSQRQAHAAHAAQVDAVRALRASGARVGALSTVDDAATCLRVILAAAASRAGAPAPATKASLRHQREQDVDPGAVSDGTARAQAGATRTHAADPGRYRR